ncbi:hypothetical protein, partial [Nocardia cyriacigeorgica]|uniref:hypothetical protein n=1 Tax=Nocardia cyriacigeorgica TaxID=135487 RepID=UPI001C49BE4B
MEFVLQQRRLRVGLSPDTEAVVVFPPRAEPDRRRGIDQRRVTCRERSPSRERRSSADIGAS